MMKSFVLVALIFLVGISLAQRHHRPNLDSSFVAKVKVVDTFRDRQRTVHGRWFMDAVGRQEAFDAELKRFGRLDLFRFYNTSKEYEFRPKHSTCHSRSFEHKFYALFDWLHLATEKDTCTKYGTKELGVHWVYQYKDKDGHVVLDLELCVNEDGNVPYWTYIQFPMDGFSREAVFEHYVPGRPPASQFTLPSECRNKVEEEIFKADGEEEIAAVVVDDEAHRFENSQEKFNIMCSLCQSVIDGLKGQVQGVATGDKVRGALGQVCGRIQFAREICETLLAGAIQQIVDDLNNKYSSDRICRDIRLCN